MRKEMADALSEFYQKILKPEFDSIHGKLSEHDERFSEISGHIESIYHRLARLEDEFLAANNRVERMEQKMKSMDEAMKSVAETWSWECGFF